MPLHLGPPYHYGLRFDCAECGANIEPKLTLEFLTSGLQDKSLKEQYSPPAEIVTLLTEPFACSNHEIPARAPEDNAVFLVALIED